MIRASWIKNSYIRKLSSWNRKHVTVTAIRLLILRHIYRLGWVNLLFINLLSPCWTVLLHMTWLFTLVAEGNEHNRNITLSSSSIFKSSCARFVIIWLKMFTCYARSLPSCIFNPYNLWLRYNLFVKVFDVNWYSSFFQISSADDKLITWYMISYAKHNHMVPTACSCRSTQSSSSIFASFYNFKVFNSPCYANKSFTLVCHNPKLSWPLNFTTSNLAPLDIAIPTRSDTTCWKNQGEKHWRDQTRMRQESDLYKGMTPLSTQNLKALGL